MRRRAEEFAGADPEDWTAEQRETFLALEPGQPLPFERHENDPAVIFGIPPAAHIRLAKSAQGAS